MGDYASVASDVVGDLGPVLVEASGIASGDSVLDIAAGSGNASIPAARTGAEVVASDLTPELLEAGRAEADDLSITWEEGDAEALPYEDSSFDAVISASARCSPRTTRTRPTSWSGCAAQADGSACSAGRRRASSGRCSPP